MTIARAYFRLLQKHSVLVSLYLIIFLAISLLQTVSSNRSEDSEIADTKPLLGIEQQSRDPEAQAFRSWLNEHFEVREAPADDNARQEAIYLGSLDAILVIPGNFGEQLHSGAGAVQLDFRANRYSGWQLRQSIENYLQMAHAFLSEPNAQSLDQDTFKKITAIHPLVHNIRSSTSTYDQTRFLSTYFRFAGYVLVAVILYIGATLNVRLSSGGVRLRSLVSPLHPLRRELEIQSCHAVLGLFIHSLFIVSALFLFPSCLYLAAFWLQALNLALLIFNLFTLATCLSALCTSTGTLSALSTVLSLLGACFCGIFVPAQYLPPLVVSLGKILPLYYYVQNTDSSLSPSLRLLNSLILLAYSAFFLLLATLINMQKSRQQELPDTQRLKEA